MHALPGLPFAKEGLERGVTMQARQWRFERGRLLGLSALLVGGVASIGCASPVMNGDDLGEAESAFTKEAFVTLPYASAIRVESRLESPPFMVSEGGSVAIVASGQWDRPDACPAAMFTISLVRDAWIGGDAGGRAFPADGQPHQETWVSLPAGSYEAEISTGSEDAACVLEGTIKIMR